MIEARPLALSIAPILEYTSHVVSFIHCPNLLQPKIRSWARNTEENYLQSEADLLSAYLLVDICDVNCLPDIVLFWLDILVLFRGTSSPTWNVKMVP